MKNKRLLTIIALISISTWVDFISILTYVGYELNLDPMGVALVTVSMLAPQALFGRFFVKVIDRYDNKKILMLSSLLRVLCTFSLIWATSVEWIVPILFIRSCAIGFFQPIIATEAKGVSSSGSVRFASTVNFINTTSKIAAPALGGVMAAVMGEKSVFILSSIMAFSAVLVMCKLSFFRTPNKTEMDKAHEFISNRHFLIMFGVAVVFLNGVGAMFTNLLPYAFNFYDIPKLTLSIAVSCSAMGGILCNLVIFKVNPRIEGFPIKHIFNSWSAIAVLFVCLALSLTLEVFSIFVIPFMFFLISVCRAYFEVYITSYIFSLSRNGALRLSALKQGLVSGSGSGIAMTILGAVSLSQFSPVMFMVVISILSLVSAFVWKQISVLEYQEMPATSSNNIEEISGD